MNRKYVMTEMNEMMNYWIIVLKHINSHIKQSNTKKKFAFIVAVHANQNKSAGSIWCRIRGDSTNHGRNVLFSKVKKSKCLILVCSQNIEIVLRGIKMFELVCELTLLFI